MIPQNDTASSLASHWILRWNFSHWHWQLANLPATNYITRVFQQFVMSYVTHVTCIQILNASQDMVWVWMGATLTAVESPMWPTCFYKGLPWSVAFWTKVHGTSSCWLFNELAILKRERSGLERGTMRLSKVGDGVASTSPALIPN